MNVIYEWFMEEQLCLCEKGEETTLEEGLE